MPKHIDTLPGQAHPNSLVTIMKMTHDGTRAREPRSFQGPKARDPITPIDLLRPDSDRGDRHRPTRAYQAGEALELVHRPTPNCSPADSSSSKAARSP